MKYHWIIVLLATQILVLMGCGSSSDSVTSDIRPYSQNLSEFTAFNPQTGQPLTVSDITPTLLSQNAPVDDTPVGGVQMNQVSSQSVADAGETLQRVQTFFLFGYTPNGEYNSNLSSYCHYENLTQMIANSDSQTSDLASSLQSWENQCTTQLSRYHTNNIATVLQFANVNYDLTQNKIQKLQFTLGDSSVVKGLLALKPGKRPLVIFKTGVYSDANDNTDGVIRNFYMNLFEETPFNVLMLGNITGEEFIKDNHTMPLGGLDEGRQILEVAKIMSDDPDYAADITDIHVVGVSLGSNGVLYSSLYNSYLPDGPSKIKSALALCPVVNLQPTMASVFKPTTVRGVFYGILSNQVLRDVYKSVPALQKLLNISELWWSDQEMYDAVSAGTLSYYQNQTENSPLEMSPFTGDKIQNSNDMWYDNNFLNFAGSVTTPTLVVYAKDDFLVRPDINAASLFTKVQNTNSNIGVLALQKGSHCGFNVAEGWPTMSALIRSYVLRHSSYKADNLQDQVLPLNIPDISAMSKQQQITQYTFSTVTGQDILKADVMYYDSSLTANDGSSCSDFDSLSAPNECYLAQKIQAHLSDFPTANLKIPQSDFESQRLNRWLNTHASLLTAGSNLILGQNFWPTQIRFHGACEAAP